MNTLRINNDDSGSLDSESTVSLVAILVSVFVAMSALCTWQRETCSGDLLAKVFFGSKLLCKTYFILKHGAGEKRAKERERRGRGGCHTARDATVVWWSGGVTARHATSSHTGWVAQ